MTESDMDLNEKYAAALDRVKKINMALISYASSPFAAKLGRNYVRPPVIRTNAILKNKNLKECLNLWEYLENYDKAGYSFIDDVYSEMPSEDYIGGLYSSVALQYVSFYSGVVEEWETNRLLSEKHLFDTTPSFDDAPETEAEDYELFDTEYKKTVPMSRLLGNKKKLSDDERRIREAIDAALLADEELYADILKQEAEERRLVRERRLREEEEIRKRAEEERRLAALEEERLAREAAEREAAEREAAEAVAEPAVEEISIDEEISAITGDEALGEYLDRMIMLVTTGKQRIRTKLSRRPAFAFSDTATDEDAVVLPYTRAQYIALPRKKKKSVLTDVKKLVRYNTTCTLIDALRALDSDNPRIVERIERLERRLEGEGKVMPTARLWQDAVVRIRR
jgi:hypothetical protein